MIIFRHKMGTTSGLLVLLLLAGVEFVAGFLWGGGSKLRSPGRGDRFALEPSRSAFQLLQTGSRLPSTYEVALNELQQLESEPLCHRTAATLLVNNCQFLEGKDEATILTDSGRQIRDFVDAYAASLAICDLERGNFVIPRECDKFRESAFTNLSLQNGARLHVTSREIDNCLSGLGTSDSAWNTWISYRHKALRFCEAARADNEKSQNILLFQRLTRIMSKLAEGMDEKIDRRMTDLDFRAQMTADRLDHLSPQLDRLRDGIHSAEDLISGNLAQALKISTDTVKSGVENAANLQRLLEVMMSTVLATNADAASAHEKSIELVSRKAESGMTNVMTAMAAAVVSASTLQEHIELSRIQAAELEYRQDNMERGMEHLMDITENLSDKYDQHTNLLHQAQNMTNEILDTLEDTAASAATLGDVLSRQSSATSWWPYIWCPAASLVMGSYGLPPSALRNLALVALGEAAGFMVSSLSSIYFDFYPSVFREVFTDWGWHKSYHPIHNMPIERNCTFT